MEFEELYKKLWAEAPKYYTLIDEKSEPEFKWFYDHMLRPLKPGETWMVCLAAREKSLSEEERKYYFLGRSEMMRESIVRFHHEGDPYKWLSEAIWAYNMDRHGLTTKNGLPYPDKTMMVYFTVNPCSSYECVKDIKQRIASEEGELVDAFVKGSFAGIDDHLYKMSKIFDHFKSVHAANPSEKFLLDFDIDIDFPSQTEERTFFKSLSSALVAVRKFKRGTFVFVRTAGGFHLTVKNEFFKQNPNEVVAFLEDFIKEHGFETTEVKYNANKLKKKGENGKVSSPMIPCPGTYQRGHLVYIVNKEDFE